MQRRFESVHQSQPARVRSLPDDHPAILQRTTIFPHSVHRPQDVPRLLVSGFNNRKIGKKITVGAWAGMPIWTLTLVERETCPHSCFNWKTCYGSAMHWARRVRPRDDGEFERLLEIELRAHAAANPGGFVVRLHVLGDFYSLDYVMFWHRMLKEIPALRIWGYTSYWSGSEDLREATIGLAVRTLNHGHPERCHIRLSTHQPLAGDTTVIDYEPAHGRVPEGLVCPAERQKNVCCATCGLCWEKRDETIVFVRHGMMGRGSQ